MYTPRVYHFWDACVMLLLGFAVRQYFYVHYHDMTWDVIWFGQFPFVLIALWRAAQLYDLSHHASVAYYAADAPKQTYRNEPRPIVTNMGKPVYDSVVPSLKINVEMLFARALIAQSRGNFDVKLTEAFWVLSGRWQKLGGVGVNDFRELIDRWDRAGAIERKNPNAENSTYIVTDGIKIGAAAAGEKLQPLPQQTTSPA